MSVDAEALVRAGDLAGALTVMLAAVRAAPTVAAPRLALFQLSALTGDWERAKRQLEAAGELDAESALLARIYLGLIEAEAMRGQIFSGAVRPVVLGEPPAFVAMLAEALAQDGRGESAAARGLRAQALEAAEAVAGRVGGAPFAWVMDGDSRLGPVLEVIVNGRYLWVPFERIQRVEIEAPQALRDLVWLPVKLVLANQGETVGFVPVRYPGSEAADDAALRLARRTEWQDLGEGQWRGLGQRMLAADTGDHALLDVRLIELEPKPDA